MSSLLEFSSLWKYFLLDSWCLEELAKFLPSSSWNNILEKNTEMPQEKIFRKEGHPIWAVDGILKN
jgi:hypothetical protein